MISMLEHATDMNHARQCNPQERDQAVQKRAYKLLAFITAKRRDFTLPALREVLETLLAGVTSSLSAAKRYRLACLQAAVLLLLAPDAPDVDLRGEDDAGMSAEEQRKQVRTWFISVSMHALPHWCRTRFL